MSIRQDGQAYRRGVVFGFTVAEVVLLLVFCLLLLFMPLILADGQKAPPLPAPPSINNPAAGDKPPLGKSDPPKNGGNAERAPLPPDWTVLVPDGQSVDPTDGPEKGEGPIPRPPASLPGPGLTLDAVCKKLRIPDATCTAESADAALVNAGRHNWPPIINLKDADGYYFVTGSAQAPPEFEVKVRKKIVPEILKYAQDFKTDVIEVVGHTDEQSIKGIGTNLDEMVFKVLRGDLSAAQLSAADNAGLGFARAVAIVQILRSEGELRHLTILPLSAAQVVNTSGKLAEGTSGGDVKQRRRIEIRLRQSEQSQMR